MPAPRCTHGTNLGIDWQQTGNPRLPTAQTNRVGNDLQCGLRITVIYQGMAIAYEAPESMAHARYRVHPPRCRR